MTTAQRRLGAVVGTVLALFIVVRVASGFLADRWWFNDLGFASVWRGVVGTQVSLALVGAIVFFGMCFGSLQFVRSVRADSHLPLAPVQLATMTLTKRKRRVIEAAVSGVLAIAMGMALSAHWDEWLRFRHGGRFGGAPDPLYHRDASYYVFRLPFYSAIASWLFVAIVVVLLVSIAGHYLVAGVMLSPGSIQVSKATRTHGLALLAALAFAKALGYYLQRYGLVTSHFGVTDGASFTDVTVRKPALYLMVWVAVATAVVLVASIRRPGFLVPGVAMALWAVLAVGLLGAAPRVVQSLRVRPNELQKEGKYISRNIEATRRAYQLDRLRERSVDPTKSTTAAGVAMSPELISRIRLWDPSVAGESMDALANRAFFSLSKADVDRYEGKPVVIAPRQLVPSKLERDSWVNRTLQYTHGYGVRIADATSSSADGSLLQQAGLPTGRVYVQDGFGGYAVLGSSTNEIDDGQLERKGKATFGVPVGSFFRRMVLGINFGDPNLVISGQIKNSSRVLWVRDVRSRASKAAPFLHFDSDPYPVVAGNRTFWVLDAYTTTTKYPYAQSAPITRLINLQAVSPDSGLAGGFNYARNSVKVVIGADDGAVRLFVTDPDDPILKVYRKAFPRVFRPASEFGPLENHLRYPTDLFAVQAELYGMYHARTAEAVQSRSNIWPTSPDPGTGQIAPQDNQQTAGSPIIAKTAMAPQYLMLEKDHLTIAQYLVSGTGGDNTNRPLIAMVTGRVDTLGRPTLEARIMKRDVPGPTQVGATFEQEKELSGRITLLSKEGSKVIRGALQILPLNGESLLYVRSIYVAAAQNSFPQLKFVAVSDGEHAAFDATLSGALATLFGRGVPLDAAEIPGIGAVGSTPTTVPGAASVGPVVGGTVFDQMQRAYDDAQSALRKGDLATYQAKVDELGRLIAGARIAPTTTLSPGPAAAATQKGSAAAPPAPTSVPSDPGTAASTPVTAPATTIRLVRPKR